MGIWTWSLHFQGLASSHIASFSLSILSVVCSPSGFSPPRIHTHTQIHTEPHPLSLPSLVLNDKKESFVQDLGEVWPKRSVEQAQSPGWGRLSVSDRWTEQCGWSMVGKWEWDTRGCACSLKVRNMGFLPSLVGSHWSVLIGSNMIWSVCSKDHRGLMWESVRSRGPGPGWPVSSYWNKPAERQCHLRRTERFKVGFDMKRERKQSLRDLLDFWTQQLGECVAMCNWSH